MIFLFQPYGINLNATCKMIHDPVLSWFNTTSWLHTSQRCTNSNSTFATTKWRLIDKGELEQDLIVPAGPGIRCCNSPLFYSLPSSCPFSPIFLQHPQTRPGIIQVVSRSQMLPRFSYNGTLMGASINLSQRLVWTIKQYLRPKYILPNCGERQYRN